MPAELNPSKRNVLEIAADLAGGRTTSRELVEAALAQITDPAGEGARTFVKVYTENARAAADATQRASAPLPDRRPSTTVRRRSAMLRSLRAFARPAPS